MVHINFDSRVYKYPVAYGPFAGLTRAGLSDTESNVPRYNVYVLRCADDSLYVGSARNLDARLTAHRQGRGAAYTFKNSPFSLVYSEAFESEEEAVARERQLKRWSHAKKEALIEHNIERLKQLSKRRS